MATVYPRECGGTSLGRQGSSPCPGLSPRVRGNQVRWTLSPSLKRSIPASAGEPRASCHQRTTRTVYPRECGGTVDDVDLDMGIEGLSPRVRGTTSSAPSSASSIGLSPRVRGNQTPTCLQKLRTRSIPASAGEPPRSSGSARPRWVYPRECGEPGTPSLPRTKLWVYPRECGGTVQPTGWFARCQGLSPRVRGNPLLIPRSNHYMRSIPASAGEPLRNSRSGVVSRSIPASAGEPFGTTARSILGGVYPRECGGTG